MGWAGLVDQMGLLSPLPTPGLVREAAACEE